MKTLITGGAGYLGSTLAHQLLETGATVRILDNLIYGGQSLSALAGHERIELIRGDIRELSAVRNALRGVDAVVHLAAIVGDPACARNPELAREVNLAGSIGLWEEARATGISRFVFASTCSNYGNLPNGAGLATEDTDLRPLSLYAETKVAVERCLLSPAPGSMASVVLRFATLYGMSPRMRFDLTVNEFVFKMITEGRLTVYGERFWRPYVHVRDAARAITTVLTAPEGTVAGGVYNVGDTAENYRKVDLVEIMARRIPGCDIQFVTKAEDPRDYRVSFERIQEQLGYQITRSVPEGIEEIIQAINLGMIAEPLSDFHHNTAPAIGRGGEPGTRRRGENGRAGRIGVELGNSKD